MGCVWDSGGSGEVVVIFAGNSEGQENEQCTVDT